MKYKFETKTIGDCCDIIKKSIHPEKGQVYTCFSLPAFDNSNTPEILNGEEIKSSKFVLDENTILFNKLNPKFRRVWNIHSLEKYENTICSTEFLPLKAKANIEQDYLYYYVSSPYFTRLMDGIRTGTSNSQQRIDWKQFLREPINVPSLPIQRKVVSLLRNIDKKIELNNAINNNLEQQAQSIFDNMFPNISNGSCTIGDYITPKRGKSLLSKNAIFGDVPVIAGGLEPSTYHNVANTRSPVLAISASGANAGYVSLWNIPIWSSDSSYIDSSMTDDVYFWYVLLKKRQKEIFDAQTGSAQPHIYPQHIASMSVSNLDIEEVHSYTSIVIPIFEIIGHHKEENTRLASLRDTLLPKLMSGELDVSNIEL